MKYPPNVTIEKETPVEDFNTYKFVHKRKTFFSAYFGNQQSFSAGGRVEKGVSANGLIIQRVRAKEKKATIRIELLVGFSKDWGRPMFMHFWFHNLSANLEETAEQIIASVREQ
ncbi:MAG: hypothetical protein ACFFFO_17745 [Candidatus Thorarchaeota archaeon]